jgi:hypothetical protein
VEKRSMERSDTNNQEAWDYYTRARELFQETWRQVETLRYLHGLTPWCHAGSF